jgi:Uma2 family endonuclease
MHANQDQRPRPDGRVVYPESDGKPMADNTRQARWITTIKGGLDARLPDFVAMDLFWYPVEGHPEIVQAPDVLVALGRPKGDRPSYKQWEEGGQAPQVVFEILSPSNRLPEMIRKQRFYEQHGVEEYYVYDPDADVIFGWVRQGAELGEVAQMDGWTSPRLGIRFDLSGSELVIRDAQGQRFETFEELHARAQAAQAQAQAALDKAERLAARLRELGVDPDAP